MAQKFGNTWWGAEWLRALSHIYYENRISRGASYARNGYVRDVKISGNTITAHVAGSRQWPYTVKMIVPPFFEDDIDKLVKGLSERPAVISQLLNRQLDPEVMNIARSQGLKIFPERWSDLMMQCSCPDWIVPCKHIAAVVYMISREIDNNPFLVFEMHNVDIIAELEKRGISLGNTHDDVEVPMVKDLVELITAKDLPRMASEVRRIDFSRLTDRMEPMLALLADDPPFAESGNFKEHYADHLQRIRKKVGRFFARRLTAEALLGDTPTASVTVDDEMTLHFDYNLQWSLGGTAKCDTDALPLSLLAINPDFLRDYHPSVAAMHQLLMCALHLIDKGAATPQIVRLANKRYAIRWMPAFIDDEVSAIMAQLEASMPTAVVKAQPTKRPTLQPIAHQAEWAVSFFLNTIIGRLAGNGGDKLHWLFFNADAQPFDGVGEKQTPGGIRAWLAAYGLSDNRYRPVFSVDENRREGFDLNIGVEDKQSDQPRYIAMDYLLNSPSMDNERFDILRSFTILSSLMDDVYRYINSGATQPIHYTAQDFAPFLMRVIPFVRMFGIKVFLPKSLQDIIRPKPTICLKRNDTDTKGFMCLDDLFTFDWEVALGDQVVSQDEFFSLTLKADSLIKFKRKYIYMDADALQKMRDAFSSTERVTPAMLLQCALTGEYNDAPIRISDEARQLIDQLTAPHDTPQPTTLRATLRPYQERGYSWMYHNRRVGFGSVLADDMGLGKTLQTIALILKLKEEGELAQGKALVVVPTGLLTNWQAEIARFAPTLTVHIYHGADRSLRHFDADILLTTYGVLRSDNAKLKKKDWEIMVIDEAQNIKNSDTAQSKAVRSMPAHTHIALSGTPVENRLTEFWSIMDYANSGYLGNIKEFKEKYANPIQLYNDSECAARFRKITAPFMMRRMKTDKSIITDLPNKIENNAYASLTPSQAALYNQTLEAAMHDIEELSANDNQTLFKRQGLILQMMLALKQICNHPAQFLKNGDTRPELSGKAEMLLDRIESIVESGEKVLVFTQFREMGDMLAKMIEERIGHRPLFYHGGCSIKERQEMVRCFQEGRSDRVFILSLKAAGTGLNLTAATHVIHYDLWWNPAVEAQATDRAYRIGQQSNVLVQRFITQNTFEERIDDMIQSKKHLADMTVASGESWIGKLSNSELREIFDNR